MSLITYYLKNSLISHENVDDNRIFTSTVIFQITQFDIAFKS